MAVCCFEPEYVCACLIVKSYFSIDAVQALFGSLNLNDWVRILCQYMEGEEGRRRRGEGEEEVVVTIVTVSLGRGEGSL